MRHLPEMVDNFNNNCTLVCHCGEELTAGTWEEAGRKFDEHHNEAEIYADADKG